MENDYIKLPDNKTPEIIEVRPIEKNVPKRITFGKENKADLLTAVLQDLGFWFNSKFRFKTN